MSASSETINNIPESHITEESAEHEIEGAQVRISELKVVDLKFQLDNRDLDKTGVKATLVERLKNALVEEGKDPEVYVFEVQTDSSVKTACKNKSISSGEAAIQDENANEEALQLSGEASIQDENANEDALQLSGEASIQDENANEEALQLSGEAAIQDENANEEALQLSVDDEEAQFNEEEGAEVSPKTNHVENAEGKQNLELLTSELPSDHAPVSSDDTPVLPSDKTVENEVGFETSSNIIEAENNVELPEKDIEKVTIASASEVTDNTSSVIAKVSKSTSKTEKKHIPLTARSLCITGLANTTRAADLKALFTKQGRVLSVKIVKSAKQVPGKCYGFVTMANSKDASKAIQNLHRTELNGRIISVERTQTDTNALLKKSDSKLATLAIKKQIAGKYILASAARLAAEMKTLSAQQAKESKHEVTKSKESTKEGKAKASNKSESVKDHKATDKSKGKDQVGKVKGKEETDKNKVKERRSTRENRDRTKTSNSSSRPFSFHDRSRLRRPFGRPAYSNRSSFRPAPPSSYKTRSSLPFERVRERERLPLRQPFRLEIDRRRNIDILPRSRFLERSEADRRRDDELFRHRMIERKQKEEALRLEREKERLQLERELLERERAEILRMEREKQRLERERIEREREELRRQAEIRLTATKRPFSQVDRDPEPFWDARKRSAPRYEGRGGFQAELPTIAPRFELPQRERPSYNRLQDLERPIRYSAQKAVEVAQRSNFSEREPRREVTIRSRNDRPVYNRNEFSRDRDKQSEFPRDRDNRSDFRDRNNRGEVRERDNRADIRERNNRADVRERDSRADVRERDSRADVRERDSRADVRERDSRADVRERDSRADVRERDSRADVRERDSRADVRERDSRAVVRERDTRADVRERDSRRNMPSRDRVERHPVSTRREPLREDWKHVRRIQQRVVTPSNSGSGQRKMNYF